MPGRPPPQSGPSVSNACPPSWRPAVVPVWLAELLDLAPRAGFPWRMGRAASAGGKVLALGLLQPPGTGRVVRGDLNWAPWERGWVGSTG